MPPTAMSYHALTENTLVDYLRGRPALAELLPHGAALSVREVGDGNLNLVFLVSNRAEPAQAVIVKQALNYLRVAGESWPLTRERMRFESQAMRLYNDLCPGLVPRVYDYDEEMSLMVRRGSSTPSSTSCRRTSSTSGPAEVQLDRQPDPRGEGRNKGPWRPAAPPRR